MQQIHVQMYGSSLDTEVSGQRMQQIEQAKTQCTANLRAVQEQLEGLRAKIATLTE